ANHRRDRLGRLPRELAPDLARVLVLAQAVVHGGAQAAVVRPLRKRDLGDEPRLDPGDVTFPHPGHLRLLREGRALPLERPQLLQEPLDLSLIEPSTDVSDPAQTVLLVHAEDKRAERPFAPALAPRVA